MLAPITIVCLANRHSCLNCPDMERSEVSVKILLEHSLAHSVYSARPPFFAGHAPLARGSAFRLLRSFISQTRAVLK
jgi:hypothetical protein